MEPFLTNPVIPDSVSSHVFPISVHDGVFSHVFKTPVPDSVSSQKGEACFKYSAMQDSCRGLFSNRSNDKGGSLSQVFSHAALAVVL